ncbi:oxidoreductase [Mucilaginibacter sp. PPCGB 2223]|uniref:MOSC domain-containing protein n=1 Tax=Mucilaginibacter sp. PPCGB 2223 TaxID=1886027 RepID=UPI0008248E83|nr:MOSC N-terminal beta barrel domain-containing protein [Mucilaginibacter sp. PPCGB 2223]OCX53320.1 oxidoreductase [Mucilaginibacter sp. PPCGB 2223]
MLRVSQLFIYPVKSLGGIELSSAEVTDRGFKYDRRWMLVDDNNRFLSQREYAEMALLKVSIADTGLLVKHAHYPGDEILVPFKPQTDQTGRFVIWDDIVTGQYVSETTDQWFSRKLKINCRLVHMPDDSHRGVNPKYAADKITSFSDAYPFMMVGQSSLDDLNNRLADKIPVNRFRPNLVFTGGEPFDEDTMGHIIINGIGFYGVKLCARCPIPTIDQDTIAKSKEPTKTLLTYRRRNNDVYFGQNFVHQGDGIISVGDEITVLEIKEMPNSLKLASI